MAISSADHHIETPAKSPQKKRVLLICADEHLRHAYMQACQLEFDFTAISEIKQADGLLNKKSGAAIIIFDDQAIEQADISMLQQLEGAKSGIVPILLCYRVPASRIAYLANRLHPYAVINSPRFEASCMEIIRSAGEYHSRQLRERIMLDKTLSGAVKLLIDMLSLFHPEAFRKTLILRKQCVAICRHMNVPHNLELEMAMMLAPLGEVLLPPGLLLRYRNAQPVTTAERELIARTPEQAKNLLRNIPQLERISEILYYSTKGFDGSGYPDGDLAGVKLPLGSRILKVLVDLWYASTDTVPDAAAFGALSINIKQYDPQILAAAKACLLANSESESQQTEIISCTVRGCKIGDILLDDVITNDARELILARGHQLTEMMIKRLLHYDRANGLRQPLRVRRIMAPVTAPAEN